MIQLYCLQGSGKEAGDLLLLELEGELEEEEVESGLVLLEERFGFVVH